MNQTKTSGSTHLNGQMCKINRIAANSLKERNGMMREDGAHSGCWCLGKGFPKELAFRLNPEKGGGLAKSSERWHCRRGEQQACGA